MKSLMEIQIWGERHHPKWIDFFRIALGMTLIWKGIAFILNLGVLDQFLRETGVADHIGASVFITILAHLIIALHLIGGVCIALGMRTRLFCLVHLPILLGAIFFVYLRQNVFRPYAQFWLTLFVFLALIAFFIMGNGKFALEHEEKAV